MNENKDDKKYWTDNTDHTWVSLAKWLGERTDTEEEQTVYLMALDTMIGEKAAELGWDPKEICFELQTAREINPPPGRFENRNHTWWNVFAKVFVDRDDNTPPSAEHQVALGFEINTVGKIVDWRKMKLIGAQH